MRALVVHNPTAGGGRAGRLAPQVVERLAGDGVEVDQHRTLSLEDARLAACQAAGEVDAVVAIGGDGTVGACAAGLADAGVSGGSPGGSGGSGGPPGWSPGESGVRAALAVIPAGGGNDAARSLGLPADDPLAAAGLLTRLRRRPADLATVDGRAYLNVAGAGFDSEVNRLANQRLRWARGRPRYVGAVLAELVVGRTASFELALDGQPERLSGWLVAVANGPSYGGGMLVAPRASLADGLLEVVVIGAIGKLEFLRTFPKVFSGRHVDHPAVAVHRAARVDLAADRPLAVYADGEPAGTLPATFEVRPAAVTVLAADPAPGFPGP
ncbi:MAG TPA: diacylglycerol kinase family protein [Actinomycetes bacterium]|nr:diacylglycerol kinase family protein [Actinomycetes bacterium]